MIDNRRDRGRNTGGMRGSQIKNAGGQRRTQGFGNQRRGGRIGYQGDQQAAPDRRQLRRAQELRDKHMMLAGDAMKSGDRVTAEYHFQHADHYFRSAAEIEAALGEHDRQDTHDNKHDKHENSRPQQYQRRSYGYEDRGDRGNDRNIAAPSSSFGQDIPAFLENGLAMKDESSDAISFVEPHKSAPQSQDDKNARIGTGSRGYRSPRRVPYNRNRDGVTNFENVQPSPEPEV